MADRVASINGRWPFLAKQFEQRNVLVVGDVMLDHTAAGQARRLSPEAPIPVLMVDDERFGLGGAANVACNLASLGARVQIAGIVGEDEDGVRLRTLCDGLSIATDAVIGSSERATTRKTRFIAGTQQVLRLDREIVAPLSAAEERALIARFQGTRVDAVVISDYAKGVVTDAVIGAALDLARRCGAPSVIDPKGLRFERYAGCTVITPNADEASVAAGLDVNSDTASEAAGRALLRSVGCEAVVVTRGRQGVSLVTADEAWHLPAHTHDVFDVTGAGDTLVAVFTLAIASGETPLAAVNVANVAAGLVVQASGVAAVTREELGHALAGLDDRQPMTSGRKDVTMKGKILNLQAVAEQSLALKRRGQRVVLTNGCFDLLHLGHVRCLRKARELGDALIVAVNSDDSVRALKGPGRPVVSAAARAEVLTAIDCVDYVTVFDAPTAEQLVTTLQPDVYVKGGDYRPGGKTVPEARIVASYGGITVFLELEAGASTSAIINTILRRDREAQVAACEVGPWR